VLGTLGELGTPAVRRDDGRTGRVLGKSLVHVTGRQRIGVERLATEREPRPPDVGALDAAAIVVLPTPPFPP